MGYSYWRPTVAVTCGVVVVLAAVFWTMRKNSSPRRTKEHAKANGTKKKERLQNGIGQETKREMTEDMRSIPELPDPNWVKVGQVQELYLYPLKSGRGREVTKCNFTEYGISLEVEEKFTIRDRAFLVYNEETGRFQTGRNYPTLLLVSLSAVDEFKVKLEAVGMPSIVFTVPENLKKGVEAIECTMWWGESIKCVDCGAEPAEWLSRFLTGTNSGLRLAYATMDSRNLFKGSWERFTKVYNTLRNEDTGLFADITSYMLMTTQSLEKLNERLEKPVPALQFRPNILVSAESPFAEDNWEWIKVGESAVIRNVKPCPRCKMVQINPETGVVESEEPLKTLRSFREQMNPDRAAVDGKAPLLGIYCGLYIRGKVNVGDDVFVHVPDPLLEAKERNGEAAAMKKSEST